MKRDRLGPAVDDGAGAEEVSPGSSGKTDGAQPLKVFKLTVHLPVPEVEWLRQNARDQGISLTHALRQAIITEQFLMDLLSKGRRLLVEEGEGDNRSVRELEFIRPNLRRRS